MSATTALPRSHLCAPIVSVSHWPPVPWIPPSQLVSSLLSRKAPPAQPALLLGTRRAPVQQKDLIACQN